MSRLKLEVYYLVDNSRVYIPLLMESWRERKISSCHVVCIFEDIMYHHAVNSYSNSQWIRSCVVTCFWPLYFVPLLIDLCSLRVVVLGSIQVGSLFFPAYAYESPLPGLSPSLDVRLLYVQSSLSVMCTRTTKVCVSVSQLFLLFPPYLYHKYRHLSPIYCPFSLHCVRLCILEYLPITAIWCPHGCDYDYEAKAFCSRRSHPSTSVQVKWTPSFFASMELMRIMSTIKRKS